MRTFLLSSLMLITSIASFSQTNKKGLATKNRLTSASVPVSYQNYVTDNWLSAAQENIEAEEYYFKQKPNAGQDLFYAANRQQNLGFIINSFGYSICPAQSSDKALTNPWKENISFRSIRKGNKVVSSKGAHNVQGRNSTIIYHHAGFSIEYTNNRQGLRQNFIINDRPDGIGNIELSLNLNGNLLPKVKNNQLQFENKEGLAMFYYRDLNVWDANHRILPATMALSNENELVINVDDRNAIYPVTIDPLNQTPEWSGTAAGILPALVNQLSVDAAYGFTVAGLGDINGDGYDDVAIGAPAMADVISGTGTLAAVGAVFIYYGAPGGLSPVAGAMLQPTTCVAGALFGYSIAGGDINNDGKSDIIVGAPLDKVSISISGGTIVSGSVGKVYAFNGATLATNTTPFLTIQLNGNGILQNVNLSVKALFGFSVAVTEDMNGDGKRDIIVGAPAYAGIKVGLLGSSLDVQSGGAFVFLSNAADNNRTIVSLAPPKSDILGIGLLQSNINGLLFGYSVDGVGDYNGDGKPDVVVGSPAGIDLSLLGALLNGKLLQGSAMIYYGTGSGVGISAGARLVATSGGLVTNLVGTVANAANLFGTSVKGITNAAGKRNGNIMVGAPLGGAITNVLGLQLKTGTVSIFIKKAASPSADVAPDNILSSPRNTNNILQLVQTNLLFGYSIDNTLDVNCDGFADIIVGEPASSGAQLLNVNVAGGAAYVYLGKADGTYQSTPVWTLTANTDAFLGLNAASLIGYSVAGAGHVKGAQFVPRILSGSPARSLDFGSGLLNLGNTFGTLFGLVAGDNGIGKANIFDTKLCALIVLPVSVTDLKAAYTNSVGHVTWTTLHEPGTRSYEIEHSIDGVNFTLKGEVAVAGNGGKEMNYEFNDKKVNAGNNYYRLKMMGANGQYLYSNVVLLKVDIKGLDVINVYPSPFVGNIKVDISSEKTDLVNIKITDMTGKSVFSKAYNVNRGSGSIAITGLAGLSKGFYMIEVKGGEKTITRKLLKQ